MRTQAHLLLFLALSAAPACHYSVQHSHTSASRSLRMSGSAQRDLVVPFELQTGDTLHLALDVGSIVVRATSGAAPTAQVRLSLGAPTDEEARQWIEEFGFAAARQAGEVRLALTGETKVVREGSTRFELRPTADVTLALPEGVSVALRTRSGSIETHGQLGASQLDSAYGSIELHGARGAVTANSNSGKVTAIDVEGDLKAKSGYGAVRAERVRGGRIALESSSGDVRLSDAQADEIELSTRYGSVELASIRGAVSGKTSSGRVEARDVEGARIELSSGYGAVSGRRLKGAIDARSSSGRVSIEESEGALNAESRYGAVLADGVWSAVSAESSSGAVEVRARPGSELASAWGLRSGYGAVTLLVPGDFACLLEARTNYGDASSDFPITIEAGAGAKSGRLLGTIAGGGPKVTLSSSSGNVALRKLDVR